MLSAEEETMERQRSLDHPDEPSDDAAADAAAVPTAAADPQLDMESLLGPLRSEDVRLLRPEFLMKWFEKYGGKADTPRKRAAELLSSSAEALPWRVDEKAVRAVFREFERSGDEINELTGLIDVDEIVEILFVPENWDAYGRVPRWMLVHELRKHGCTPIPHRRGLEALQETALGRQQLRDLGGGDAFLDVNSMSPEEAEQMQVISVSYCWLRPDHPDPNLFHLATLNKLAACFMKGSEKRAKAKFYLGKPKEYYRDRGYTFGAGVGAVGIFLDWCSLYQDKPKGSRTAREQASFDGALSSATIWYTHRRSIVWMLNHLPSDQGKTPCEPWIDRNGNEVTSEVRKNHDGSAWPTLERLVASILKPPGDLLDITFALRSRLLWLDEKDPVSDGIEPQFFEKDPKTNELPQDKHGEAILRESKEHKAFVADQLNRPLCRAYTKGDYLKLTLDTMCQERVVPLAPDQFEALVDKKRFGVRADAPVVKRLYRDVFEAIIASAPSLAFSELRLQDSMVRPFLGVVSMHCYGLTDLNMSHNEIMLPLEEWAKALGRLPQLEKLDLSWNSWLGGNIKSLSSLGSLRSLQLYDCLKVTGDLRGLSGLTTLEDLNLTNTSVTGNLTGLTTLLSMESLSLRGCNVKGDMEVLEVLSKLTYLDLPYGSVDGDLKALRARIPGLSEPQFPSALKGSADADATSERVITQSERVLAAMAAAEAEAAAGSMAGSAAPPSRGGTPAAADAKKAAADDPANEDDPYSDSDEEESLPPVEKPLPWPLNEPPGMFAVKDQEYRRPLLNFSLPRCAPGLPDITGRIDLESLESPVKRKMYQEGSSARLNGGVFSL